MGSHAFQNSFCQRIFDLFGMRHTSSGVIVDILLSCNIVTLIGSVHFTILVQKSNSDRNPLCLLRQ